MHSVACQLAVKQLVVTTEHKEWKRNVDVHWQIMKGTANIIKKYFCPRLILSVLLILGVGFYFLFW